MSIIPELILPPTMTLAPSQPCPPLMTLALDHLPIFQSGIYIGLSIVHPIYGQIFKLAIVSL